MLLVSWGSRSSADIKVRRGAIGVLGSKSSADIKVRQGAIGVLGVKVLSRHKGKTGRYWCSGQGPHSTGKTENGQRNSFRENQGNLKTLPKYRENIVNFCQNIGNFLILNNKCTAIFYLKFHKFSQELDVSAMSVLHMKHPQITNIGAGKNCSWTGKTQGI